MRVGSWSSELGRWALLFSLCLILSLGVAGPWRRLHAFSCDTGAPLENGAEEVQIVSDGEGSDTDYDWVLFDDDVSKFVDDLRITPEYPLPCFRHKFTSSSRCSVFSTYSTASEIALSPE